MEEAVSFLNSNRTGIAVGTPVRLMDLLDVIINESGRAVTLASIGVVAFSLAGGEPLTLPRTMTSFTVCYSYCIPL